MTANGLDFQFLRRTHGWSEAQLYLNIIRLNHCQSSNIAILNC